MDWASEEGQLIAARVEDLLTNPSCRVANPCFSWVCEDLEKVIGLPGAQFDNPCWERPKSAVDNELDYRVPVFPS